MIRGETADSETPNGVLHATSDEQSIWRAISGEKTSSSALLQAPSAPRFLTAGFKVKFRGCDGLQKVPDITQQNASAAERDVSELRTQSPGRGPFSCEGPRTRFRGRNDARKEWRGGPKRRESKGFREKNNFDLFSSDCALVPWQAAEGTECRHRLGSVTLKPSRWPERERD